MLARLALPAPLVRVLKAVWVVVLAAAAIGLGLVIGNVAISPMALQAVSYLGLVFCAGLLIVDPVRGLLLWVVISPYARFIPLDVALGHGIPDLKLDRIIAGLLIIVVIAQIAARKRRLTPFVWADLWLVLFTLITFQTYVRSPMSLTQLLQAYLDRWLVPMIAYFGARQYLTSRRDVGKLASSLALIGVYLGVIAIHEQLTGVTWFYVENRSLVYTEDVRRVVGLLGNPATLAACVATAAPFVAMALVEARKGWRKVVYSAVLLVMAAGVALCYNRAGWVAFVAGLLVMVPFYARFRKAFVPVFIAAAVGLVAFGGALMALPSVQERVLAQKPIEYRSAVWGIALRVLADFPAAGVGQGYYARLYNRYARGADYQYFDPNNPRVEPSPHNSLLAIAVNGGLMVLLPYLGFLLAFVLSTWRFFRRTRERDLPGREVLVAAWGAFVSYNVTGVFADMALVTYPTILFMVAAGAALGWMTNEGRKMEASTST
jgi:O-antigen ligase